MKIVLSTQIRENYGAHSWDGEGECPQYWKFKGGNTYVVENVSVEQAQDPSYWDFISSLVSSADDYFEEYVIGNELIDDCDDVSQYHNKWESPIYIVPSLSDMNGQFSKVDVNDEYGYMRREISSKYSTWIQSVGAVRDNDSHVCTYIMRNGEVLDYASMCAAMAEAV